MTMLRQSSLARAGANLARLATSPGGSVVLFTWFLVWDAVVILPAVFGSYPAGGDAIIYARGASAYLHGTSPWDAYLQFGSSVAHFAGLPPTVIAFLPFALLPDAVVAAIWVAGSALAAVLALRALRLPLWWLAFPPLIDGIWSGNPQIVVLALLVAAPRLEWLAAVIKVYAFVPLLGERRWRALALTIFAFVVTAIVAWPAWIDYLQHFTAISDRLTAEAGGGFSSFGNPMELLVTTAALALLATVDLRAAGWLAVPAA
ncbi:MAG TPA: glycosyltransferase 87 family protein, partial [Candidatus Sulfotelmatobacter sp.]|nr:glycosyltransferase 87 family protein [Candidatus Sulfotelmatobacter sp.]